MKAHTYTLAMWNCGECVCLLVEGTLDHPPTVVPDNTGENGSELVAGTSTKSFLSLSPQNLFLYI